MHPHRRHRSAVIILGAITVAACFAATSTAGSPAADPAARPRAVAVNTHTVVLDAGPDGIEATATCPDRRAQAVGGGFDLANDGHASASHPEGQRAWYVKATEPGVVYVRCLLIT
ncbi:hypothetical protein ACFY7C_36450 [Streptomyces sp. NPDC012769]|uniref:hypothetical protein n=1 Tax=Streptomyces sp. NPDC012769 TaxID=3364848 RepID=UPI00367BBC7E